MTSPIDDRKSSIMNFVANLFHVVRYTTTTSRRYPALRLKLESISRGRFPELDVSLVGKSTTNQLVVKVARQFREFDSEPRLISDAIAAFHNDNMRLGRDLDPLASKVMPGIVVDGTMPTFYKIPITPELVRAVEYGEHPEEETVVHGYRPAVPRPEEGIRPLDNRYIIFSCFAAFKKFVPD
jgi:hypothetical protein